MKAKLALCAAVALLTSACAGTPTWDTNAFPQQVSYGSSEAQAPAAVATAPAK